MNAPLHDEDLSEATHWINRMVFPALFYSFLGNQALMAVCLYHGWYWPAALLVLTASHLMHGLLISLHEASHGLLRKKFRFVNEVEGVMLGMFSFTSFSLYRAAHQSHHAHLSTERDEELWPFVIPTMPRWRRILAAVIELNFGIFYTPFLFLRAFLRKGTAIRNRKVRRRVWVELIAMAVTWAVVLGATAHFGTWKYLLWMHFAPGFIAGNLQSWRKYIEHVGMTGTTVNGLTRNIVARGWPAYLLSFTLLHEPYHGVHHQHSGLTFDKLPARAAELEPRSEEEVAPFAGYRYALVHLVRTLPDPRVGSQWRAAA